MTFLQRGITSAHRGALLSDEYRERGWKLKPREGDRSITTPWGVVYLSIDSGDLHVIAHELVHIRQMGGHPWLWTLRYLLDPWFRARAEIEAEAMEAAFWVRWKGKPDTDVAKHIHAPYFGRWGRPYFFLFSNRDKMMAECARQAAILLANQP